MRAGRKIKQYSLSGELIRSWDSVSEAAKELGFPVSNIHRCCSGMIKTSNGFVWRFQEDDFGKYSVKKREVKDYYAELIYKDHVDFFNNGCLIKIKEFFSIMKDEPNLVEFRIYEKPTKELIYSSKIN